MTERDLGGVVGKMVLPDRVDGDFGFRESGVSRMEWVVERVADSDWQSGSDVEERDSQQHQRGSWWLVSEHWPTCTAQQVSK